MRHCEYGRSLLSELRYPPYSYAYCSYCRLNIIITVPYDYSTHRLPYPSTHRRHAIDGQKMPTHICNIDFFKINKSKSRIDTVPRRPLSIAIINKIDNSRGSKDQLRSIFPILRIVKSITHQDTVPQIRGRRRIRW